MKNLFTMLLLVAFATIGFAQDTANKKKAMPMREMKQYSCPMHPEMMKDQPGKCPKCGMDLTESKHHGRTYCPMCKEKTVIKDGKCSKCGKKIAKHGGKGHTQGYVCSSCHTKCKKSGKCPKCGSKIEERK